MIHQALDFLKLHIEVAFATCEAGRPRIRMFQIMKQEGTTFYFATSPKKQVYKQLHESPFVEIMASEGDEFVKCSGRADFSVDDATQQWIYDNNAVLSRLYTSYDKMVYFKMNIEQIDYYNLAPTPPVFKHYDLINHTEGNGYVGERYSKEA